MSLIIVCFNHSKQLCQIFAVVEDYTGNSEIKLKGTRIHMLTLEMEVYKIVASIYKI